jgi:hypothetical protein
MHDFEKKEVEHSEGTLSGLHFMSSKCCASLLPAPYDCCTNEICPEVERTDPEVEAIQVRGDEVQKAPVEMAQTNTEHENMTVGLTRSYGIAARRVGLVRDNCQTKIFNKIIYCITVYNKQSVARHAHNEVPFPRIQYIARTKCQIPRY